MDGMTINHIVSIDHGSYDCDDPPMSGIKRGGSSTRRLLSPPKEVSWTETPGTWHWKPWPLWKKIGNPKRPENYEVQSENPKLSGKLKTFSDIFWRLWALDGVLTLNLCHSKGEVRGCIIDFPWLNKHVCNVGTSVNITSHHEAYMGAVRKSR